MWCIINDWMGLICVLITYLMVILVAIGFVRIGIWEGINQGKLLSQLHLILFLYHCLLIFWSHFKSMTTEPGILQKKLFNLEFVRLPNHI